MGAFKQLLTSDIIVSPFEVNKSNTFVISSSGATYGVATYDGVDVYDLSNLPLIDRYLGTNTDFYTDKTTTGNSNEQYTSLVYNSIKQLYYSNYLSSSYGSAANRPEILPGADSAGDTLFGETYTPNFYNYLSSDLALERFFPTASNAEVGVIGIPSGYFGDHIEPKSVRISGSGYVLIDDGEGSLITEEPYYGFHYGNVIYEHGIIVLTNSASYAAGNNGGATYAPGGGGYSVSVYGVNTYMESGALITPAISSVISGDVEVNFSSSYQINETQYRINVRESEFNFSQNPSLLSGSEGAIYDYATSSYFNPYVTTVGLYNDNQELIAVGKLNQPLPLSSTTDTNIFINIDR